MLAVQEQKKKNPKHTKKNPTNQPQQKTQPPDI